MAQTSSSSSLDTQDEQRASNPYRNNRASLSRERYSRYSNANFSGYEQQQRYNQAPSPTMSGVDELSYQERPFSSNSRYSFDEYNHRYSSASLARQSEADAYATHESLLWTEKNAEPDDWLHDARTLGKDGNVFSTAGSKRGWANVLGLAVLAGGFIALFAGWPIYVYVTEPPAPDLGGFSTGGINGSGQVPDIPNLPTMIDPATPQSAHSKTGFNGEDYKLVFSDEFEQDGRTFWPGDDPWWEAIDLNYWQTGNLEWLDPGAVTTKDGAMEITISRMDPSKNHNLTYRSAMVQSWNKLCYTGGHIEISASLPGNPRQIGFWPGLWSMGNLGRAGFGGSNDGMWPYSYDTCDVGTLQNQTYPDGTPSGARTSGSRDYGGSLSYLRGQRYSACTCKGEDHPGPNNRVGRGAPEIDILEAEIDGDAHGRASQSFQLAPFDNAYDWDNRTTNGLEIYDPSITHLNLWKGSINQEAASGVTATGRSTYESPTEAGPAFQTFGYEYEPGGGADSYITWFVNDTATWKLKAGAFGPSAPVEIDQRLIPTEPMYLIMNTGISNKFQGVLSESMQANLPLPAKFRIDYVRIYQKDGQTIGCSPDNMPTERYIQDNLELYMNPNLTRYPRSNPKNRLVDNCSQ